MYTAQHILQYHDITAEPNKC